MRRLALAALLNILEKCIICTGRTLKYPGKQARRDIRQRRIYSEAAINSVLCNCRHSTIGSARQSGVCVSASVTQARSLTLQHRTPAFDTSDSYSSSNSYLTSLSHHVGGREFPSRVRTDDKSAPCWAPHSRATDMLVCNFKKQQNVSKLGKGAP